MIHNTLWKSTQVPDIDIISTSNRWKRSLQESSSGKSLASDITSQLTTTKLSEMAITTSYSIPI